MQYLFAYFLKLVAFFSFCMFLAILVKRSALALGFLGLWQVVEGLVAIFFQYIKVKTGTNLFESVYNFFPLNAMWDLIVEPISRLGVAQSAANQFGEKWQQNYDVQWQTILIVLCWTALFIYWSYALLRKRDL